MTFLGRPLHEYAFTCALFVLSVIYLAMAFTYPREAREVPVLVGAALVALSALDLLSMTNLAPARWLRRVNPTSAPDPDKEKQDVRRELLAGSVVLGFVALIYLIGLVAGIAIYVAGSMIIMGRMRIIPCVIVGVLIAAVCYALFQFALGVDLYPGLIFAAPDSA